MSTEAWFFIIGLSFGYFIGAIISAYFFFKIIHRKKKPLPEP